MSFKMIAFDLDGTTLQDDHETFSERLVSALTRAHEKGLWIIPSTGRPYGALPPALQGHPVWESYGVLSNGEQIRDLRTGEKRYKQTINPTMIILKTNLMCMFTHSIRH